MNIFDFDNTLYHGESSVDMALFLIKSNKKVILHLPSIFSSLLLYKLCIASREQLESTINNFLKTAIKDKDELERLVEKFWEQYQYRLDKRLLKLVRNDDIIISAGPTLLISKIKNCLNTDNIIGTEIDGDEKKVTYFNFGSNKVKRFRKLYKNAKVNCFFTDSYNDQAMMDIAEKVYIVNKGRLKRIK